MTDAQLDHWLEQWARWCVRGALLPAAKSMLAKMIDNGGVMSTGTGGAKVPQDGIEAAIEAAVMRLAGLEKTVLTAEILRAEYMGGDDAQLLKAKRLNCSVRTYRRRLKDGRETVRGALQVYLGGMA